MMDFILPVSAGIVGAAVVVGILIYFVVKISAMLTDILSRGSLDE